MRIGVDASRAFIEQPTGTERYAYEVITRMLALPEAEKHEWVLYVKQNFQISNFQSIIKYSNVSIKTIPLKYLWTQVGLASRTWVDRLDVLWVPAHTLPGLRKPGIKTVVTIHGIEYEWLPAYESALQRWYLPWSTIYAVRSATQVIAVSEFTKKQLIAQNYLGSLRLEDQKKIKVILEGYETQSQTLRLKVKKTILDKYNLRPKEYLLFVGTVQPRKNLARLIKVFAGMKKAKKLKLVIAGKLGWTYEDVVNAPRKYGAEDRVVITGYLDDTSRQELLAGALVYVQPSITEGFGIPVLEAMSQGVPVVSSNGGALPEVVRKAGLLFDPSNDQDMETQINRVVGDSGLRATLVSEGKKNLKLFSWEKAAKETLKYLTSFNL